MLMSLYPTDLPEDKVRVIEQALKLNVRCFFTSLHIPEATALVDFIVELAQLHQKHRFEYIVDISPQMLELLGWELQEVEKLYASGVRCLRIDYGFTLEQIQFLSTLGFQIALNASTVQKSELESLTAVDLIGIHNYYPRIETGLSETYFEKQNDLLRQFNIPIYMFIPGEQGQRMPLYRGLPTLESNRGQNAYVNYLLNHKKYPDIPIILAEGYLQDTSLSYLEHFFKEELITVPLADLVVDYHTPLLQEKFMVRVEEAASSWRLEGTRGILKTRQQEKIKRHREKGELYIDNEVYKRYAGELHIMRQKMTEDIGTQYIGRIDEQYQGLLEAFSGHPQIKFELLGGK